MNLRFVIATSIRCVVAFTLLWGAAANAAPTTPKQAQKVVLAWLKSEKRPVGISIGTAPKSVATFTDSKKKPAFFIVSLKPKGFVIVSGDDLVEPIIGFSNAKQFTNKSTNPLRALLQADMKARLNHVRNAPSSGRAMASAVVSSARLKWDTLLGRKISSQQRAAAARTSIITGPRVDPILKSRWDQGKDTSNISWLYNYFTPNHYWAGCVATAVAQLLRHYQYPSVGVGTASFPISVNGTASTGQLRGGDDVGGPYQWSQMPLVPNGASLTASQRTAIGRLLSDAGVSSNMMYGSSSSGAYVTNAATALKSTFKFSSAKWLYHNNDNIPAAALAKAIIPNLHAGHPVFLAIWGGPYGHAVLCDGYGYNSNTIYHHINMGWSGNDDAWYNLPTVDATYIGFNVINEVLYNIFPSGTGEIIAGRVTDSAGLPIADAVVSGGGFTATTNARGLYAIENVPSNISLTLSPQKSGYVFNTSTVASGRSDDWGYYGLPGNSVVDFVATVAVQAPAITAQPMALTVNPGQAATFSVGVTGSAPLTFQWRKNGLDIANANSSSFVITNPQAIDSGSSFSVVVSNSAGTVVSTNASLTVNTPPVITTQPQSATVFAGQTHILTVFATGSAPLFYQWRKNGVDIAGATSGALNIVNPQSVDSGSRYSVLVSNLLGSVLSNEAILTLHAAPTITTQPLPVSVQAGQQASFTVVVAGSSPLTFQWRKNGVNIAGATTATYTTNAQLADNGALFQVAVTNAAGSVLSSAARLSVASSNFTISGVVTRNGAPLAGVSMNGGTLGTVVTDTSGRYQFQNIPSGTTYIIRPAFSGLQFTPGDPRGTVTANTVINFTAAPTTYIVIGQVTVGGVPLSGVTVSGGIYGSTTTDANGKYVISGIPVNANYLVVPSSPRHIFSPSYYGGPARANRVGNFAATKVR